MSFQRTASAFPPKAPAKRQPRTRGAPVLTDKLVPSIDYETAQAAEAFGNNTAFEAVFERLRTSQLAAFANSKSGTAGVLERETAHLYLTVLDKIKQDIQSMADEIKLHRRPAEAE